MTGSASDATIRNVSGTATVNSVASVNDLTIVHTAAGLTMGPISVSNLTATAAGDIQQTAAWSVSSDTSLTATGNIDLGTHDNTFAGNLALIGSSSTAVIRNVSGTATVDTLTSVVDLTIEHTTTSVTLDAISLSNLTIDAAGGILQTAAWTVSGNTSLTAGGNIDLGTLDNSLAGSLTIVGAASDATIRNISGTATIDSVSAVADLTIVHSTAGVTMGSISVSNLSIDAAGAIQQTDAWTVASDTVLIAAGNISLGGQDNALSGTLSITGSSSDATIRNVSGSASVDSVTSIDDLTIVHTTAGLTMGAISVASLTINAAGAVQQTDAWTVGSNTTLTATGDILLGGRDNNLAGTLTLTGSSTDAAIRNISATATVDAVSAITDLTIEHTTTGVTLDAISRKRTDDRCGWRNSTDRCMDRCQQRLTDGDRQHQPGNTEQLHCGIACDCWNLQRRHNPQHQWNGDHRFRFVGR